MKSYDQTVEILTTAVGPALAVSLANEIHQRVAGWEPSVDGDFYVMDHSYLEAKAVDSKVWCKEFADNTQIRLFDHLKGLRAIVRWDQIKGCNTPEEVRGTAWQE